MTIQRNIQKAISIIKNGGIIAYPTEAVYGLGCDPFNKQAVYNLLNLKHRSVEKGLILIASSWNQIKDLVKPVPNDLLNKVKATWPGPITWIFPAQNTPKWISGKYNSVALRVTAHPIAKKICSTYNGPIVSTSANIENMRPAKTSEEVQKQFSNKVDFIVKGTVGPLKKPTEIRDVMTKNILRESS